MKKGKLLSILTSLAMTSSMVLSAVPSTTASAAAANPLGLQLTSEKTSFSLDEIKAGQSATVYVDATGPISESDKVGSVEFKLKSSAWGKVDPVDLYLCDPNVLETSKGSQPKKAYNATGTMVISKWEGTKPSKVGYALQDYASVGTFSGYSDDYMPSVILISDSTKGFLKTGTEGQHIAQFNVNFPKDLAEGTYTISFVDAKSMICVDGEFGSNNSEMAAAPAAKSITFTVGSGQGPANPDPVVTDAPNPTPAPSGEVVMTENPVIKDADKTYDADATLKGGVVKAKAGEQVDVPVYLELGANADPKYITGIGFKVKYDTSALELVDMSDGDGFISDGGFNSDAGTGVFLFTFTTEDIQIDPTKPIGTLTFKVNSSAADGTYPVHITNHLNGDTSAVQIIHTQNPGKDATYFVPHVTDGAVVVGAGGGNDTPVTEPSPSKIDENRIYDGDATLKGETVKAKAGETVNVPVYLELGANVDPKFITGIGFKAVYDTSALQLTDISDGEGFISDGGFNSDTGTGVFLFTFTTEDIEIDPTRPIATFTFKVSGNATGSYPVKFVNHLFGEEANIQIVHTQYAGKEATYLKPTVVNGAVVVDGGSVETTLNNVDGNRIYDGDANLKVDTVKANAGETVDVPVYLELGANVDPKYITGIGFKVVYDKSALELVDMTDSDGFMSDGGFNCDTETGVFLYTFTTEDIEIDPTKPIGVLTFKVKDGVANGTYKVELINHLFDGANIQIIHTQYPQKDATYLTPHLTNGAVIVGDTVITTAEPQPTPVPVESTTLNDIDGNRIYDGDAYLKGERVKGNRGAEVQVPVYLELGANVDPKYITGIGFKVKYDKSALELVDMTDSDGFMSDGGFNCDTDTGVFLYTFTTEDIEIDPTKPIGILTFKVKDTAADGEYPVEFINHLFDGANIQIIHTQYPQKEATYLTPHVTNGAVIIGDVAETTPAPQPGPAVETTPYQPGPAVETTPYQPGPVQTEVVTSIVTQYVTIPGETVTSIVTEYVTLPAETVTVIVTVPVPVEGSTTPVPGPQPTGKVSISINDNENHWYYADENSWNLSQVKVYVDGNETNVSASDLKFSVGGNSNATPSNTYQKGTFDYKVTVSYQDATAEFTAKIGQRGDANCDHDVNVRDAAAIAKDLASLIKNNNKTALTKEGGFGVFLGNADGGQGGKEAYAPYDLTVRDAAVIAKFLSQKVAHPEQTLKDLAVK